MIVLLQSNLGIFQLRKFGVDWVYIDLPGVVIWQHIMHIMLVFYLLIQLNLTSDEDPTKLVMQYRTRRRGFHYYVQGQVKECLKMSE